MEKGKISIVHLKYNLRNSRQISGTMPKVRRRTVFVFKNQEVETHIPFEIHSSTVMGKSSTHIPVNPDDMKDYDKLFLLLKFAKSLITDRLVVLIEHPLFKTDLVKNVERALMKFVSYEKMFIHPELNKEPENNGL